MLAVGGGPGCPRRTAENEGLAGGEPSHATSGRRRSRTGRGRRRGGGSAMLVRLARPYPGRTALAIVTLVAYTAASRSLPPYLAKIAVDDGILAGDLETLTVVVVAFVAAGLAAFVLSALQTYFTGWVGERALADLRIRLFRHLQRLSLGFFERNRTGAVVSRITNDVEALDQLVTDGLSSLVQNGLVLAGDGGRPLHPRLAARARDAPRPSADGRARPRGSACARIARTGACASGSGSSPPRSPRTSRACASCSRSRASRRARRASAAINERVPGRELRDRRAERHLLPGGGRALVGRDRDRPRLRRLARRRREPDRRERSSRSCSTSRTSSTRCSSSRSSTTRSSPRRPRSTGSSSCSTRSPRSWTRRTRASSRAFAAHVRFEHVDFGYGDLPDVLHGFDLDVPAGTTVALVGHTGAGKSTIAKLLARFYDPRAGRITIDGHDLREVTQESLRSQLGIVPQEGFLFAGTVAENIAFGRPAATRAEIESAAARRRRGRVRRRRCRTATTRSSASADSGSPSASASSSRSRARCSPTRASSSSTRRRRRSTSAPSGASSRACAACSPDGRAFVIAHRLSTIQRADLIVVLDHGRIVEQGTHDELIAAGGAYTAPVRRLGRGRRLTAARLGFAPRTGGMPA